MAVISAGRDWAMLIASFHLFSCAQHNAQMLHIEKQSTLCPCNHHCHWHYHHCAPLFLLTLRKFLTVFHSMRLTCFSEHLVERNFVSFIYCVQQSPSSIKILGLQGRLGRCHTDTHTSHLTCTTVFSILRIGDFSKEYCICSSGIMRGLIMFSHQNRYF